ncbi:MAG: tRNA (adenosine(37)-N6)-threonylcarbamoyltransferase complex ATPase subunit type 1 TsaE [Acholeplasmatales bacterium]|nr:MAG: tRNA (adenosine(37)-N6)-threonylcarbamoyltransferase complex ATPase subunit type 1 TsaE [Acholeplasmatales bacterium]
MAIHVSIENLAAMQHFAKQLSTYLFPGFVLCLSGDLGAGKTTLTQFLGREMGIEATINSPTFTLMKTYDEGHLELVHIDAYRLENMGGDASLEEAISQAEVAVIEWYEHLLDNLPETYLTIHLRHDGGERRLLSIEGGGRYAAIAEALGA